MHTFAVIVAGLMTLFLAGPAVRGNMLTAWLCAIAMVVPYLVLYAAFSDSGNTRMYLAPIVIGAAIIVGKSVVRLFDMAAGTPKAAVNAPAGTGDRHWAEA